ncbi:MAG: regulatory protein RecX [Chloroflexi bacterium]|nr:regulatory protein RecX [Chloroflexota bacterium]
MDDPSSLPLIHTIRPAGQGRMRLITLTDGREFVFSDHACERVGPREGDLAAEALFHALEAAEQRSVAHEAALRLLSHRARSEQEMRTRLAMRGIAPEAIDDEVLRLRRAGLLDDEKFARAWVEDRRQSAPRGRRMLRYELLSRGIEPESVDAVTDGIDDLATAEALAIRKARTLAGATYEVFAGKVGGFLRRRGFDYQVASQATRAAWEQANGGEPPEEPPSDDPS